MSLNATEAAGTEVKAHACCYYEERKVNGHHKAMEMHPISCKINAGENVMDPFNVPQIILYLFVWNNNANKIARDWPQWRWTEFKGN